MYIFGRVWNFWATGNCSQAAAPKAPKNWTHVAENPQKLSFRCSDFFLRTNPKIIFGSRFVPPPNCQPQLQLQLYVKNSSSMWNLDSHYEGWAEISSWCSKMHRSSYKKSWRRLMQDRQGKLYTSFPIDSMFIYINIRTYVHVMMKIEIRCQRAMRS